MSDTQALPAIGAELSTHFVSEEGRAFFCVTYTGTREQLVGAGLCVPAQFPKKARERRNSKSTPAEWGEFAIRQSIADATRWELRRWPEPEEVLAGMSFADLCRYWRNATAPDGGVVTLPERLPALRAALLDAWKRANPGMND